MVGAFAGQGSTLVCGGGVLTYEDCKIHPGDKNICSRNVECVGTAGNARWCTGAPNMITFGFGSLNSG